jgi:hypothetical protein
MENMGFIYYIFKPYANYYTKLSSLQETIFFAS